jgi:hypothetical protein
VQVYTGHREIPSPIGPFHETKGAHQSLLCSRQCEACMRMDEPMNCSDETHDVTNGPADSSPPRRAMLCSLRVVPVSSEHFPGRRYVMELSTTGRARELRIYRSLEQLMCGVGELGLRPQLQNDLYGQLLKEGSCHLLDIVL